MVFFFLMIRRPPRSTRTDTLCPYTTRFRSGRQEVPLGKGLGEAADRKMPGLRRTKSSGEQDGHATIMRHLRHINAAACPGQQNVGHDEIRSEEHTSELQSLMRISYAVFCLKKKKQTHNKDT